MVTGKKSDESDENDHRSGQSDSPREIVDLVKRYTDLLNDTWQTTRDAKELEFRKLKLILKSQLALSCPSPLILSLLERDSNTKGTELSVDMLQIPDTLRRKIIQAAKKLRCKENEAIIAVLSEHISAYTEENKEEDDDVIDF